MEWPQITWIVLISISLLITASDHGKPKDGNHNVFTSIIAVGVSFFILYSGGFFN